MSSTTTDGDSFEDFSEGSSIENDSDYLSTTTHSSNNSSRFRSSDISGRMEENSQTSDEKTSVLSSDESDPLSSFESDQSTSSSVCESEGSEEKGRMWSCEKVVFLIVLFFVLFLMLLGTFTIVVFVGGINIGGFNISNFAPKATYYYLECSLKDSRLCDSGKHKVLNDMDHGFVSFDEEKDEFLIVFSDRDEYRYLFSELQKYFKSIQPWMASSYGGGYGGGYDSGGGDFNNMEYLGAGYDVFTANPLFSAGVDNGFRMNIFDTTSPMAAIDAKNSLSCDLDFDVYVMDSDSKLRDTRHNVVKINHKQSKRPSPQYDYDEYEGNGDVPNQRGAFSLPTFTLSHDNLKTVMKISTKNRVFALTSSECEIYRMNLIKFDHPQPTQTFANAVNSLVDRPWDELAEEEREIYIDFIEAFGTHVVTKAHMGAKFSYEYEMNKYYYQKEDTHNVQNSLKLLGIDATWIDNQKTEDTLDDLIVNMRLLSVGARPVYSIDRSNSPDEKERDKAELWASSSEINPLPIHYEVTPISEYYFYEFGMKVNLLYGVFVPGNMERAIQDYYNRAKLYMDNHPRYLEKCEMEDGKAFKYGDFSCLGSPSKEKLEWWAARQKCQMWGGDLVVVDDRVKNYFVSENFVSDSSWIGYYYLNKIVPNKKMLSAGVEEDKKKKKKKDDDDEDEKFVNMRMMKWVNGEPSGYENWAEDQPDGGNKKKKSKNKKRGFDDDCEFCINTNFEQSSAWADSNCRTRMEYVCERPLHPPSNYISSSEDEDDGTEQPAKIGKRRKDCSDGMVHNGFCYRHFREGMDWGSAKFECRRWVPVSWGGKLAMVKSEEVENFMKEDLLPHSLSEGKEKDLSDYSSEYKIAYEKMMSKGQSSSGLRGMDMRKYVWIGLTDIGEEDVWKWEDGQYMDSYRRWDVTVNKDKKKHYDCVAMNKKSGLWVYGDCYNMKREFVCQYKM